ncbi:MAG: glycoside hydrolase N-terminal domain-containing protein [Ignavibacteriales bacterium]|nr:glycoside hydrolase N-terminal domain-containing protein [Ignavibacteriales bacterium]
MLAGRERAPTQRGDDLGGEPRRQQQPRRPREPPLIRQALFEGRYAEASALAEKHLLGTPPRIRSYQPLGDLLIDLDDARAGTGLPSGPSTFGTAWPLWSARPGRGAARARGLRLGRRRRPGRPDLGRPQGADHGDDPPGDGRGTPRRRRSRKPSSSSPAGSSTRPDPSSGPGGRAYALAARLLALNDGGRLVGVGDGLRVEGAKALTLILAAATDYDPVRLDFDPAIDPAAKAAATSAGAGSILFKGFERATSPSIGRSSTASSSRSAAGPRPRALPTDERLAPRQGRRATTLGLAALYFQYGRYLLMGQSRARRSLPANLQGIWNDGHRSAPGTPTTTPTSTCR